MRRRLLLFLITAVYVTLLLHFLYSNIVSTIGLNYTIKSAGYTRDYNAFCDVGPLSSGDVVNCDLYNCPAFSGSLTPVLKGFPFTTEDAYNRCGDPQNIFEPSDFDLARILDMIYLVVITGFYLGIIIKLLLGLG